CARLPPLDHSCSPVLHVSSSPARLMPVPVLAASAVPARLAPPSPTRRSSDLRVRLPAVEDPDSTVAESSAMSTAPPELNVRLSKFAVPQAPIVTPPAPLNDALPPTLNVSSTSARLMDVPVMAASAVTATLAPP